MRKKIIVVLLCIATHLYANDIFQIKNGELYDENHTRVELNQYDHLEALSNGNKIKYIARLEKSWNYTFYFFDVNGKQDSSFNIGNKYELPWINFSPDEEFFVLEDGTWIIRSMEVYSFPSLKNIETQVYKRYYFWIDNYLYFNSISKEKIVGYPADDDNYCFLSRLNPSTKKIEVVINWNECNQYEAKSYQNNVILLENKYVLDKSDWNDSKKWKTRILKINIMDCSFRQAFINDNLVRFRKEPSLSSEKILNFAKNDHVQILSRTTEMTNVDGSNNYWYLVQDSIGNIGYVFGDYISLIK